MISTSMGWFLSGVAPLTAGLAGHATVEAVSPPARLGNRGWGDLRRAHAHLRRETIRRFRPLR